MDIVNTKGFDNEMIISEKIKYPSLFRINIIGNNNKLTIEDNVTFTGGGIDIFSNNSEIKIGMNCILNARLVIKGDDAVLNIGNSVTMMNVRVSLHEKGLIEIGDDCMFSGGIVMDVSDMHSILDAATMKRINPPKDIIIKSHVWLANGVTVLKGVTIGQNSIIGAKSLVSKDIPDGCLAVGVPAKVIKTGITWDRKRLPY